MNKTENAENWFSRAKAEADKGVPLNERFVGVVIVVVSFLMILYYITHQVRSTGFFTSTFDTLETILLYGSQISWATTGALEGIFGQRLLSRLFDVFGGIIFITISTAWLFVVFPFEFTYFADALPDFLRFLVQWISNDIAKGIMAVGIVFFVFAVVYSPIAYKFINIDRFKRIEK